MLQNVQYFPSLLDIVDLERTDCHVQIAVAIIKPSMGLNCIHVSSSPVALPPLLAGACP